MSVDDRVVEMDFDNSRFERAVSTTMNTLRKLKSSLDFSSSKKGMDELQTSASKFSLAGLGTSIDGISNKLTTMKVVGVAALAGLVSKAVDSGIRVAKAFTLDPITAGFKNYETQINAVQTILANTGLKGQKGLDQVTAALGVLNKYANQTVYNFSDMASNIGTFTAAGVKLQPAVNAIKGIANLAALSGSTTEQASTAMYQLSQAIASGKVGLQDWNSVVNAGMGGKVFQEALYNTAQAMGRINKTGKKQSFEQWTKSGNSFRNSLKSGWINADVLTRTLSQFTGDLTDAQLKAMGYNAAQIKQIQAMALTAKNAATKIKTFSQLTQALKEEVASAYGNIFKTLFGDINQATTIFSKAHVVLENALTGPINSLNSLLEAAVKLGARAKILDAIKNAFADLGAVIKPIKEAFREIFPPTTAKQVYALTVNIDNFFKKLKIGADTANNLKRTFAGVFAAFDIGRQVIKGIFGVLTKLFGALAGGSGGILKFTGGIGDFLVALDKAIKKGGGLAKFFDQLGDKLVVPVKALAKLRNSFFGLFDGFSGPSANQVSDSLGSISDEASSFYTAVSRKLAPAMAAIKNAFSNFGQTIAKGMNGANFDRVLKTIQTGLLGGIFLLVKRFFSKGINVNLDGGLIGTVKETFESLTKSLKLMQTQIKANILLKIAAAMAILTISIVALSLIDGAKLQKALTAMGFAFGELLAAMAILTKISGSAGFIKLPFIAASLILLAGAIVLLTGAVKILSTMSWEELTKGLVGVAALLGAVAAAVKLMPPGMGTTGLGIVAIAAGINLLAIAVKSFAQMSWAELAKGLTGVAAALGLITLAVKLMPKGMAGTGLGVAAIAVGINLLYFAVKNFATLDWKTMARGLVGVAGSLLAIAGAMRLMPKGMVAQAAALILVGTALQLIVRAVAAMAQMSWSALGKGLAGLAASLAILAGALYLMEGALPGAAALLIVSGALAVLVPVLKTLGAMSWGAIAKGLIVLAAAFTIIGIAGLLLTPLAPGLILLGIAITALGAGLFLAGAGAALFATAFTALAAVGTAGVAVLIASITAFIGIIPKVISGIVTALVGIATSFAKAAPALISAFTTIATGLLTAVALLAPKMATAMTAVLLSLLTVIKNIFPTFVTAGFALLTSFLTGIQNNIGAITTTVGNIIVNFLNAMTAQMPRIITAGTNLVVALLVGIAKNLGKVAVAATSVLARFMLTVANLLPKIISAGATLLVRFMAGIAGQLPRVVAGAARMIVTFINQVTRSLPSIITSGANLLVRFLSGVAGQIGRVTVTAGTVIARFLSGIARSVPSIVRAGTNIMISFIAALGNNALRLTNEAFNVMIAFINGLANTARNRIPELEAAGYNLAVAIVNGMISGIGRNIGAVTNKLVGGLSHAVNQAKGFLGINSPSKVFIAIGSSMMEGTQKGIVTNTYRATGAIENSMGKIVTTMSNSLSKLPDVMSNVNTQPKITPVLDLSNVKKGSKNIGALLGSTPIKAGFSYTQATGIAAGTAANSKAPVDPRNTAVSTVPVIQFTQNNNSPKALSAADIYRQTKNQLSLAKGALNV